MKLLFVGGTGLISSACSQLAVHRGDDLYLLIRGASSKFPAPPGSTTLKADIRTDPSRLSALLSDHHFDAVVDFIAYAPSDIHRDIALFRGRTDQYVFISSASAYQKPPRHYLITEETPLDNPFWQYSRDKIACETVLMNAYRAENFPVTIIRPSLTYGPAQIPLVGASWTHPYTVVDRIKRGRKVIVPGDGTSLWVLTWNADFARGLIGLLGNKDAAGESFHITSDEVLTWNQIFLELYQALEISPNILHIPSDLIVAHNPDALGSLIGDKVNSVVFDNSKIKRFVPDFKCQTNWREGVRLALAWFEADPARRSIDEQMDKTWDEIIANYEKILPA